MEKSDIPIFAKSYDLYKALYALRATVPKQDRHGLWLRAETTALALIEALAVTGRRTAGRLQALEEASVRLDVLRVLVRLAKDTRAIDLKAYARLQSVIDEIGRMIGGWMKACLPEARHRRPGP